MGSISLLKLWSLTGKEYIMKKHDKVIVIVLLAVAFGLASVPTMLNAVDELDWAGVLPHIYSGSTGDGAINIAYTSSTVGWDVSEETATTNALVEVESVTLTTSGTPATNLGPKKTFTVETSASHTEDLGYHGVSIADGTLDSEDGDYEIGLMAAGAAAATKWTLGSTGIVTQVGGATLDNATSATELNITETTVQLTGAVNLDGGIVTVNQDSGDYDFIVESNDVADALKVDAGINTVQLGAWVSYERATSAAQSYSIASAGKAAIYEMSYSATGASTAHLMTDLLTSPGAGGTFWIIDTGGSGDTNNIVIDTEGSETINGAATYTIDADYGAVQLYTDGTNFYVLKASQ